LIWNYSSKKGVERKLKIKSWIKLILLVIATVCPFIKEHDDNKEKKELKVAADIRDSLYNENLKKYGKEYTDSLKIYNKINSDSLKSYSENMNLQQKSGQKVKRHF
jgi:hypothetical protein